VFPTFASLPFTSFHADFFAVRASLRW